MRRLALSLLLVVSAVAWSPAAADQNDPRLDGLFIMLKETSDPYNAIGVENAIWIIWHETDNQGAAELLADGTAAMHSGSYDRALELFDNLIAEAPDFAEGWNKRATVQYLRGDYEASLADIDETLKREPRHFGALSGRGLVYTEMGQPAEAVSAFEEALEIHPSLRGARANLEALRRLIEPI
jgi:tetratricopeptide (TPR) repeat protein